MSQTFLMTIFFLFFKEWNNSEEIGICGGEVITQYHIFPDICLQQCHVMPCYCAGLLGLGYCGVPSRLVPLCSVPSTIQVVNKDLMWKNDAENQGSDPHLYIADPDPFFSL